MKKILKTVTLMLSLAVAPHLEAADAGTTGMADGVGAGGSGGNPTSMGTSSEGSFAPMGLKPAGVTTTSTVTTTTVSAPSLKSESTVLVNREELLKAVDAALNTSDLEMEINDKPRTVRLKTFDLQRGILSGKVLETNRAIRLIDESKATVEASVKADR